jgi:cell division transport system permease protein
MRANFVMQSVGSGIRRNLLMFTALVLTTAIALGFVGASLLANTEIGKFRSAYENKINVSIYLCPTHPESQPSCGGKRTSDAQTAALRSTLDADPNVKSYKYFTEDEAYDLGKKQDPALAKYLLPGVLPASFSVSLRDLQHDYDGFQAKYSALPGVGQVTNQIDTVRTLLNIIDKVRIFSIILAIVVLVASTMLISITIQVAADQRKNETGIMRLVGASRWMTELPFMLEAMIAAAVGGILATVGLWVGKHYVLAVIFSGPTKRGVIPNLGINDVLLAGGVGLLTGIALSALTAFATLRLRVKL